MQFWFVHFIRGHLRRNAGHLSLAFPLCPLQDSRTVVLKLVLFLNSCSSNLDSPGGSDDKVSAYNAGDVGSIPESGRFPWRRKWQPIPIFCLENLMDGGVWWATVRGVAESDTTERLQFHFSSNLGYVH